MKKLGIISLGCDKNRVDTEKMLSYLGENKYIVTDDISQADIIIVNTCGFIEKARQESIDAILESLEQKSKTDAKVIVSGCLSKKYFDELTHELSEVDAYIGTENYSNIEQVIDSVSEGKKYYDITPVDDIDKYSRIITTPSHYAYLKIAEGCSNHCTYCTIPSIRGKYRSRDFDSLIKEAKMLAERGVKELILVAQDCGRYGFDKSGTYELPRLVNSLSKIDGIEWIRIMYCYPETITDELLDTIKNNPKVCKYLDIPFQHAHDRILKLMNRKITSAELDSMIKKIRAADQNISIRSTFIIGFPSESEKEFEAILDFLKKHNLNNVGFFTYSKEEGTPAAKLKDQIPEKIKNKRLKIAANVQKKIVEQNNKNAIGNVYKVLYEGIDYDKNMFYGRTEYNAPDVDTLVYFTADFADIGEFYNIKITNTLGYDLKGEKV